MNSHLITAICLILAIVFYTLGAAGLGTGLLILGLIAEGAFWFRLFTSGRSNGTPL